MQLRLFSSCDKWGLLCCSVWPSHCGGFSCFKAQALGHAGFHSCHMSVVAVPRLQSTGSVVMAYGLPGMWDLPGSGIELMSPALAGKQIYIKYYIYIGSVQFSSVSQLCPTLCDPMNRSTPGLPGHHQLPEFTQTHLHIESVMPSSHLILCHPLLLLCPVPPSIRVFSNESTLHMRWPKYWSFSFSISPSNEHPGLISFRMDWLDLLAVQGTLNSLLKHHSSKASIFWHSAFFIVQLSYPYMTTG